MAMHVIFAESKVIFRGTLVLMASVYLKRLFAIFYF